MCIIKNYWQIFFYQGQSQTTKFFSGSDSMVLVSVMICILALCILPAEKIEESQSFVLPNPDPKTRLKPNDVMYVHVLYTAPLSHENHMMIT